MREGRKERRKKKERGRKEGGREGGKERKECSRGGREKEKKKLFL